MATTGDVRFLSVGYSPADCGPHQCEHVHLFNCDTQPINLAGWTLTSLNTGDRFTFPNYVAPPGCEQTQFTVNTHAVGNEDAAAGIFTWNQSLAVEEWSPLGGKAELRDSAGKLVTTCIYAATPTLEDSRCRVAPAAAPRATDTVTPTVTSAPTLGAAVPVTPTLKNTAPLTPTATVTPTLAATPTVAAACVPAPILFDPPDQKTFYAKNTILRWRSDYELQAGEQFDVLVWHAGIDGQPSIGVTRDKTMPIDFTTWQYNGILGKFYWTVKIKSAAGALLSCPTPPIVFILTPPPPPAPPPPEPTKKPYGVAIEEHSVFANALGVLFPLLGVGVVGAARLRMRRRKRPDHPGT